MDYGASVVVAKSGSGQEQGDGTDVSVARKYHVTSIQELAKGILVGKRMPSAKVLNQSDARPWHFQELLPSNGRWRVVVFAGDISKTEQREKLDSVGRAISEKSSFLNLFTPVGASYDVVFEILAIHSAPRVKTTIFDFPEVFRQYNEVEGHDYWKIYVDDVSYHEGHGQYYEKFEISPKGCTVIIRPDQYVSYVGPMEDIEAVNTFFTGFMVPQALQKPWKSNTVVGGNDDLNGIRAKAVDTRGV